MRASLLRTTLAALLAGLGQAQYLIGELSFGATGRLSDSPGKIPGFTISGAPTTPEVLSNKLIMTPISPGSVRSAVWSDGALLHDTWTVDVDFRATGPERAGGAIHIWLAADGARRIATRDLYTAGKFEGLVLIADGYGGGMLRAFLNDGAVDFASRAQVDPLAFGQCRFPYRNLGRPSQLKLRQTVAKFTVEIDGQPCFDSDKVSIPTGYQLGISAVTPDVPDSFEVFKMVTMADNPHPPAKPNANANANANANTNNNNNNANSNANTQASSSSSEWENPADEDADIFVTSKAQFQDLHQRLQITNHQLSALFNTFNTRALAEEKRYSELKQVLAPLPDAAAKLAALPDLQVRMDRLESEMRSLRTELSRRIDDNERAVRGVLSGHHDSLTRRMADSVPGHGALVAILVGCNLVFAAVYVVYKRRKSSPKKYL